jgi:hypothetical protein
MEGMKRPVSEAAYASDHICCFGHLVLRPLAVLAFVLVTLHKGAVHESTVWYWRLGGRWGCWWGGPFRGCLCKGSESRKGSHLLVSRHSATENGNLKCPAGRHIRTNLVF